MGNININIPVVHLVVLPSGERRAYNMLGNSSWTPFYGSEAQIVVPLDLYTAYKLGMVYEHEIPEHIRSWWAMTLENR